jgi:hypothetical protein
MTPDEQVLSQAPITVSEFRHFIDTLPRGRDVAIMLGGTHTEPMPLSGMIAFTDRFPSHYDAVDTEYQRRLVELRKSGGWLLCKFGNIDGSAFLRLGDLEPGALHTTDGRRLLQAFRKLQVDIDLGLEKRVFKDFLSSYWILAEDVSSELRKSHPLTSGMLPVIFKTLRQALDVWNLPTETLNVRMATWAGPGLTNAAQGAMNMIAGNALIDMFNSKAIAGRNTKISETWRPAFLQIAAICSASGI